MSARFAAHKSNFQNGYGPRLYLIERMRTVLQISADSRKVVFNCYQYSMERKKTFRTNNFTFNSAIFTIRSQYEFPQLIVRQMSRGMFMGRLRGMSHCEPSRRSNLSVNLEAHPCWIQTPREELRRINPAESSKGSIWRIPLDDSGSRSIVHEANLLSRAIHRTAQVDPNGHSLGRYTKGTN